MQFRFSSSNASFAAASQKLWLRVLMIAAALFCGSAGYGAVTPQPDDDIAVTVVSSSTQERVSMDVHQTTLAQRHAIGSTSQLLNVNTPPLDSRPDASEVRLSGLCRNNR